MTKFHLIYSYYKLNKMTEESNMNILASANSNIIIINGVEFPIEYPDSPYNISNEKPEENTKTTVVVNDRYINIIETLGLNININYPINILIDAIVELHTINTNNNKYVTHHARCFQFKNNSLSQKIKNNLTVHLSNHFSKKDIKYALRYLLQKFKYDKVVNSLEEKEKATLTQHQETMIGFNYSNPRWNTLSSYSIEI